MGLEAGIPRERQGPLQGTKALFLIANNTERPALVELYYSWICWWAISCLLSSGSAFAPSQKLWTIYWALTPPAPESPQAPVVQAKCAPCVGEKDAWHMVGPRALSAERLNDSMSRGDIPACPCSLPGHGHLCPTLASCSLLFSSQTLHLKCISWGILLLLVHQRPHSWVPHCLQVQCFEVHPAGENRKHRHSRKEGTIQKWAKEPMARGWEFTSSTSHLYHTEFQMQWNSWQFAKGASKQCFLFVFLFHDATILA